MHTLTFPPNGGSAVTRSYFRVGSGIEARTAPAHPATVDVLASLIAEVDSATAAGEFYDHVCEALCRLTSMERAGVLLYDPATRAVRAVGSHGLDRELLGRVEGTLDETPIARRALDEDRVIVVSDDLASQIPSRYEEFAGIGTLVCGPVAAGNRWFGIIMADRGGGRFDPSAEDRETMLTLGRLASLAASVERATRQDEAARQLRSRIDLTREIHDRVMQRLFGLTLAIGSGRSLTAEERRTCHDQLQAALADLRSALSRPAGSVAEPPRSTLREVVSRRAERTPALAVDWPGEAEVPDHLEALAQSVFVEAMRNCEKHATPTRVDLTVTEADHAFELEVVSDGAHGPGPGAGLGLKLLAVEALQDDALLDFGPLRGGRWRVRLVGARQRT